MNITRLLWLFAAATGLVLAADSPKPAPEVDQPTVVTAVRGKIIGGNTETVITYDQAVTVTATNLHLTCDHLEIVLTRLGDKSETVSAEDKFKSLVATGNVHITQGDREASCGRAEVLPGADKIVLTEKPVVVHNDGKNTIVDAGSRITFFRGDNRIEVEAPETTLPSMKNFGAKPGSLPPATPGAKQP